MPKEEYTDLISQSMILSHLYGMNSTNEYMGRLKSKYMREEENQIIFEEIPLSYDETIKFFISKNIITKSEFEKIEKKLRKYAFTVAKIESERILKKIKDSIIDAIKKGIDITEWIKQIDMIFANAGITKLNDYHIKTVFRTNMQTALNEGKMQIMDLANPEEFPLLEYVAIEDDRVRGSHLRLNGFRAPKNEPIWQQITPPLDFNCRCTVRPVYIEEKLKASKKKPDLSGDGFGFIH